MKADKFRVKDGFDVIMEGTSKEIQRHFNLAKSNHLGIYARKGMLIQGKYTVEYLLDDDDHLKWQVRHLIQDGNTVCHGKPEKNLAELRELGFECEAVPYTNVSLKGRKKKDWIIKCIKK